MNFDLELDQAVANSFNEKQSKFPGEHTSHLNDDPSTFSNASRLFQYLWEFTDDNNVASVKCNLHPPVLGKWWSKIDNDCTFIDSPCKST